ncbi:MAG: siderophore-interacting protein [Rhodobacteraceae bacterium]|nr:siderophore-interacting protein [Paracoccaceae bacterium]
MVERVAPLGAAMARVTLRAIGGPVPLAVRTHAGHCRLLFPDHAADGGARPRVFTYRRWHADGGFDIDFALHGGTGPAARWIARAKVGDRLGWKHGGAPKLSLTAELPGPVVLIGDATAQPVISALLERAPAGLRGHVLLLSTHLEGLLPLAAPAGVAVRTVASAAACEAALRRLTLSPATTLFAALEAGAMRALRRIALEELRLPHAQVFTSGYWKAGLSAEEVDDAKRRPDWFGDAPSHMA